MGLLVSLVAFGNLTDYDTNFAFVQHVLTMDTTFPSSTIRYRAITNPALHHAAYALIIATEILTAALCWMGALQLSRHIGDTGQGFNRANTKSH
jgi:predicted small integral membrane protein